MASRDVRGREGLPRRAHQLRRVASWLASRKGDEVTSAELAALFPGRRSRAARARLVAQLLVKHGVLQRRAPGNYRVLRAGTEPAPVLPGERLDHWLGWDRYAVAYASAMAVHGLAMPDGPLHLLRPWPAHRLPSGLGLELVDHQRRLRALADLERVRDPKLGVVTVRSLARTAVDAAEYPEHSGGIRIAAQLVRRALDAKGAAAIAAAADSSVRRAGICRLGYLLALAGAETSVLKPLRKRAQGRFHDLEPGGGKGRLESTWRLRLNVPEEALRAALATGSAPAPAG